MFINYLPPIISTSSELILFADDINVIIACKNFEYFSAVPNTFLSHISKWFTSNKLVLNLDKTNTIKFVPNKSPQHDLNISYDEKYTEESINSKVLGLQIDNHLNWKNHIDLMIPK
jgi:hypothetical protein